LTRRITGALPAESNRSSLPAISARTLSALAIPPRPLPSAARLDGAQVQDPWLEHQRPAHRRLDSEHQSRPSGVVRDVVGNLANWGEGTAIAGGWIEGRTAAELSAVPPQDLGTMTMVVSHAEDRRLASELVTGLEPTWLSKDQEGQLGAKDYWGIVVIALYDYRPRGADAMAEWFAAKRRGRYPVIGALADAGEG
jgi:hypothetical protein